MSPTKKTLLFTGALALSPLTNLGITPALAQAPTPPPSVAVVAPPALPVPRNPAPMLAPRPLATVNTAPATGPAPSSAYWGQPPAPKKPNALHRFLNRVGGWMDGDDDTTSRPVYRDPTTGRTNRVGSEPWLKMLDK